MRSADAERRRLLGALKAYRLLAEPRVAQDLLHARFHYEKQREGLGDEFLDEIAATYARVQENPLKYQILRSDIRRALCRRFPFCVFFTVQYDVITVLAVFHTAQNPEEWKKL